MKNIIPLTIGFIFITLTGCVTPLPRMPEVDFTRFTPPGPVTSVVAAWEPAISHGEHPQRGFGGRVYFHDQDMRPVRVRGKVIVYTFIEDGRCPHDVKPDEGIVFDDATLNSRGVYQRTRLGHSYNLWVPIDDARPDSPAKLVSLMVRFIPNRGVAQMSSMSTIHLPGKSRGEFENTQPQWNVQTHSNTPHHHAGLQHNRQPQTLEAVTIR